MNKEETIKAIKVMQAYVDGKAIINDFGQLMENETNPLPAWAWDDNSNKYHIKPEPREVYVAFNSDGSIYHCVTSKPVNSDYLKMREVME